MISVNKTSSFKIFDIFIYAFFIIMCAGMIVPFWNTLIMSVSPEVENSKLALRLFTDKLDLAGYKVIWNAGQLLPAFLITVYITVVGTFLHLFFCSMAGYVLTKPKLPGKQAFIKYILVSMMIPWQLIMVPIFVVYRNFGLINNINSLVLSGMIGGFTIIAMRNYFLTIPYALQEAAKIDGASEFRIFMTIFLPLSKPGLATVALFQLIAKWNTLFEGVLFINDVSKQPLQVILREIVSSFTSNNVNAIKSAGGAMLGKNVQSAAIIISILPLLVIYPLLQKHFINGIMSGAIKG